MFTNLKEDGIYMSYNKDRLEKYWLEVVMEDYHMVQK